MSGELNFEQRLVAGKVKQIFTTGVELELEHAVLGITTARIAHNHYLPGQEWHMNQRVEQIFLYDLSAQAGPRHGHWFASQRWGQPELNPWHKSHPCHPHSGQIVEGKVIGHAGESAVLRIGAHQLEAFLHLQQVPDGRWHVLQDWLPMGMQIRAQVSKVVAQSCRIELSVTDYLKQLESQQGHGPHAIGERIAPTPYLRLCNAGTVLQQHGVRSDDSERWHGKGVLVLDDDKNFRNSICAWLRQFGAQVWDADNVIHAKQLLNEQVISHVMLDYSIGSRQVQAEFLRLLKTVHQEKHIAIISGQPEEGVPRYAKRLGLGFLAKPIGFHAADQWLRTGITPEFDVSNFQPGQYWQHAAGDVSVDIGGRAENWLKTLCRQMHAVAACWLRCYRPGYEIVAEYGMGFASFPEQKKIFLSNVKQSLVSDVEFDRQPKEMAKNDIVPWRPAWPDPASHVWAEPMSLPHQKDVVDDILLVFSQHGFQFLHKENQTWQDLQAWWRDLAALQVAQERLSEESVFASQGRVHGASLHEMRPLVQVFECNQVWDAQKAIEWWPSGQKIKRLIDGGLYNIKPERAAQINLRDRMQSLMTNYVWQFVDRRAITTIVHLPPKELVVCLPPEIFEQTLINLVDNATKFCKRRFWARVEVSVYIDPHDLLRPLVMTVKDQGFGMLPEQERNIFHSRYSGGGGFGMGLYVSASLARAVGGELKLKSNLRWSGCEFELRLPLQWGQIPDKEVTS